MQQLLVELLSLIRTPKVHITWITYSESEIFTFPHCAKSKLLLLLLKIKTFGCGEEFGSLAFMQQTVYHMTAVFETFGEMHS